MRGWYQGFFANVPCHQCGGRRLCREALAVLVGGAGISEITSMSVAEADSFFRDLTLTEDDIILEVRNSLRSLKRAEASVLIREREIEAAKKESLATQIRFEAGEMDSRNVSDAQNALLRAQNAYVQERVQYEIARIQLLRDIGILFIDEQGSVVEP